jgi:type IV secretion system protein TrbI
MLTPTGPSQSPTSLPPPPRRFRGRRLTRVPAMIASGVAVIIAGVVIYNQYNRGQLQVQNRQQDETKPQPADASGILDNAPSGFIDAKFHWPPKVNLAPPVNTGEPAKPLPTSNPPAPDDNGLEATRQQAWKDYWAEYLQQRKDRFDKRKAALAGGSSGVSFVAQAGGAPAGAGVSGASAIPASAPVPASAGPQNGFGGYAGWSGYGGLPGLGLGPGLGPAPQIDNAAQRQKIEFANQTGDLGHDDMVQSVRQPPDPFAVMAGSYVKFTTETEVNSDVPGSEIGRVTEAVSNNDGSCILIPQGSKLIGHYNSQVSTGQSRLPGVLTRIIYPDGSSQAIGAMESADNAGSAGMEDQINRHLLEKFGSALVAGAFGAAIQLSVPQQAYGGYTSAQIIGASLGQQMGQLGQQIAQQNLSIPNTITIRAGYNGTMITDKDIHITPWSCGTATAHPMLPIRTGDD